MNELTKELAIRLVREHSWSEQVAQCGHRGCEEHTGDGAKRIHTRSGGIGADALLEDIERQIQAAHSVDWTLSLMGHDLVITEPDGRILCLEVPNPTRSLRTL